MMSGHIHHVGNVGSCHVVAHTIVHLANLWAELVRQCVVSEKARLQTTEERPQDLPEFEILKLNFEIISLRSCQLS